MAYMKEMKAVRGVQRKYLHRSMLSSVELCQLEFSETIVVAALGGRVGEGLGL
jgi:hypothetical protein